MSRVAMSERLAILGGPSIRNKPWPKWPRADPETERNLLDVLHSDRWAISGMFSGRKPYERRFSEAFAKFVDVPYCVPVCNGSASLTVALQALGVGYGDEVIVPGLTWVACAAAVARIGAIPVLVDVEPDTLCISVNAARRALSPRTRAIMIVHLYSAVADIDGFLRLSNETRIPILEDCSHAHGAMWRSQRVGTFGRIGAFSLQESKLLTSGEGGVAITRDPDLYDLMVQLRDDGRVYTDNAPGIGWPDVVEVGDVLGTNFCMSEFHAAISLDRLKHLDHENDIRAQNARCLDNLLVEVDNVFPLGRRPEITRPTYFKYCVRVERDAFGNADIDLIRRALMAELNIYLEPLDDPLNNCVLYNPLRSPIISKEHRDELNPSRFSLPIATKARQDCLTFPHSLFLDNEDGMEDISAAFMKIKSNCHTLSQIPLGC